MLIGLNDMCVYVNTVLHKDGVYHTVFCKCFVR
jgi:hypothetical protein